MNKYTHKTPVNLVEVILLRIFKITIKKLLTKLHEKDIENLHIGLAPENQFTTIFAHALSELDIKFSLFDQEPKSSVLWPVQNYSVLEQSGCNIWWVLSPNYSEAIIGKLVEKKIPLKKIYSNIHFEHTCQYDFEQIFNDIKYFSNDDELNITANLIYKLELYKTTIKLISSYYLPKADNKFADLLWLKGICHAKEKQFYSAVKLLDEWGNIDSAKGVLTQKVNKKVEKIKTNSIIIISMMKSASEFFRSFYEKLTNAPVAYPDIGVHPHNQLVPSLLNNAAKANAVIRTHIDASEFNIQILNDSGIKSILLLVRDPRQALLSWVHHINRISFAEFNNLRALYSPNIPIQFRHWDFNQQFSWALKHVAPGLVEFLVSWKDLLSRKPTQFKIMLLSYEEFIHNKVLYLSKAASLFDIPERISSEVAKSILNLPGRNMRKGIADEWRAVYTDNQKTKFNDILDTSILQFYRWIK